MAAAALIMVVMMPAAALPVLVVMVTAVSVAVIVVVVADNIGVIFQSARDKSVHSLVCRAGDSAVQCDPHLAQSGLCSSSDASADQRVRADSLQKPRQRSVTLAVGTCDLRIDYLSVLDIVELEILCPSEMLEYLSACDVVGGYSSAPVSCSSAACSFLPPMQISETSFISIPSISQPFSMRGLSHYAANFLSFHFFMKLLTSMSVMPFGRILAAAWMMPLSSSTVKRLFSIALSGSTSVHIP